MEQPKVNISRVRILYLLIGIIFLIINFIIYKRINILTIPACFILSFYLPMLIFRETKSRDLYVVYFSSMGITYYRRKGLISYIEWDDLNVTIIKPMLNFTNTMKFKFSSQKKPSETFVLNVGWFIENSVLDLTKKYVPQKNDLHKHMAAYASKRNIDF